MTKLASSDIAELDPYTHMAVIGKRVIHPGGPWRSWPGLPPGRLTCGRWPG